MAWMWSGRGEASMPLWGADAAGHHHEPPACCHGCCRCRCACFRLMALTQELVAAGRSASAGSLWHNATHAEHARPMMQVRWGLGTAAVGLGTPGIMHRVLIVWHSSSRAPAWVCSVGAATVWLWPEEQADTVPGPLPHLATHLRGCSTPLSCAGVAAGGFQCRAAQPAGSLGCRPLRVGSTVCAGGLCAGLKGGGGQGGVEGRGGE